MVGGGTDLGDGLERSKGGLWASLDDHAEAKLREAALIPEVLCSPSRVSPRLARAAAEHTLVKAERRLQSRNLEVTEGNLMVNPFSSLSLSSAVVNLRDLGLRGYSSSAVLFERNVQNLLERGAVLERPSAEFGVGEGYFSECDSVNSEEFERKALDYLCGDLMEEIFDEDSYHLKGDSIVVQRKPGAKSSRKRASRKLKVKINKVIVS
jgi:hypothetical protein